MQRKSGALTLADTGSYHKGDTLLVTRSKSVAEYTSSLGGCTCVETFASDCDSISSMREIRGASIAISWQMTSEA